METKEVMPKNLYPALSITRITNPNRFYAVPLIGFLVKILMLIPQFFEMLILSIAVFFMVFLINPFVVLFTGKYWDSAYQLYSGLLKLSLKIYFFIYGLTNTYPGFDFTIHDSYKIVIEKPSNPSRLLLFPFLGLVIRAIMLIPFLIYEGIIANAAYLAALGGAIPVLFQGRYPETTFELARDSVRLNLAISMYIGGLSDKYPSFWISMNHQTIKIMLIILAVMMSAANWTNPATQPKTSNYEIQKDVMQQFKGSDSSDLKTGY